VKRVKTMKDMRGFSCFVILGGMVLILCCINTSAYASLQDLRLDYVPGEIIVSFEPSITESDVGDLASEFNFSVIRKLRLQHRNTYLIKFGDDHTEEGLISQLIQNADVLYAERNGIFRIPETWPSFPEVINPMPTDDGGQISFEYLVEIDLDVSPYPRGGGAPPLDIDDEAVFRIYPPDWQLQFGPPVIVGEDDGILEYLLPPDRELLSYPPRFNGDMSFGLEPIDIRAIFDSYNLNTNSYEPAPSFEGISSSITVVPEPATLLLFAFGGLVLRRKR